jgi:hypothetical protein
MNMLRLKTPCKDNTGREYTAYLYNDDNYSNGLPGLKFEGAPSGWWLKTLKDHTSDRLYIDFGQGWYCVNIQEILQEIRDLLERS